MGMINPLPVCKPPKMEFPMFWKTKMKTEIKNEDGTFNEFIVQGGTFETWVRDIAELEERIRNSRNVFEKLEQDEINGTNLVFPLLDSFSSRLATLEAQMKLYREQQIKA